MVQDNPKLTRVREIVASLPDTSEKLSHGSPTFWGGKKTFASFHANHHGDGRLALWVKSSMDAQEMWIAGDPQRFFVPPYVGPSGWIGVRLEGKVDWSLVREVLIERYRMVAPKRALARFDGD